METGANGPHGASVVFPAAGVTRQEPDPVMILPRPNTARTAAGLVPKAKAVSWETVQRRQQLRPHRQVYKNINNYHLIPWRDSISGPIAPVSTVAGGDDVTMLKKLFKSV
jgi:hypothetical protein